MQSNGDELPTARDAGPLGAGLGTEEGSEQPQASAVMVADVEPLGDRLLLFYRCSRAPSLGPQARVSRL